MGPERTSSYAALVLFALAVPLYGESASAADTYDGAYFKRVTLVVADMDRSLAVYRDILGFDLDGISESGPDSYSYPVFKIPAEAKIRFATLSAGREQVRTLALTEVTGVELPAPRTPLPSAAVIRVADIEAVFTEIEALGLETVDGRFIDGREFDFHERAFIDPDGHLIVLYQVVDGGER